MPRKPREFVDGGIYHIFNRGNNRRTLFDTSREFRCFLNLLEEAKKRYRVEIYHYCLMSNHFHLLLQSESGSSLPRMMHWLQLGYARYYKKIYETTGHIFEERFRSPRISEESYYLQCGRYIERNPVKANLVRFPEDYPYSSASYYAKGILDPLITPNLYYLEMGKDALERQKGYRQFLSLEEPYSPLIEEQLLKY